MILTSPPLVSVIIPAFNSEKTIQETIESVLNQTWKNLELIVVNDGSQDATLDVIASIKDPRLTVLSYPNSGVSASRNRGISQAKGEFISFLDADDLWTLDKLETQLKALQDNPQAGVAYSWTDHIDDNSKLLRAGAHYIINGDVYAELLKSNFVANGSNILVRAQALREIGGFNQSFTPAEDWDMYLRLASRYHFVAVPSAQILYRIISTSASSNVFKMEAVSLQIIEQHYSQGSKFLQPAKKESLSNLYKYLIYKVFEEPTGRGKGFKAAKLLWLYLKKDKARHRLIRSKFSLLSKVVATIVIPNYQPKLDW
ncbi:glycosyltransferase [Synechocystis sp. PCC 7509]|uniref:glycosyltransferase n=1 Tax=Synechocystis sp. PCC 7509 TaxID=927677 RepID=UPI0002ACD493|nr:glycosyltransferase [Synechocystis sp. PCC 7509]